ncbi:helix-turn-helix transcriptional regulator [Microvirga aerophila]|uniref:Transcriptional activator protein BjaR1 n=1 Tax=Microvirga aerophila TaxID=670291 RepID=A0A512BM34_9HYPH|nr:LuxR family transcriptional regulator [Microvirga aerophila]GEO12927.1 transcriptional activator protein BjaR1 [Microvirga aerophila]
MAPNCGSIDQVFEFVEVCETLTSFEECMHAIRPIVADLGFSSFILTGLPLLNRPLEPLVLLDSWPGGWMERYSSQNYFEVDPVGQNVLATSSPFLWGDAPNQRDESLSRPMLGEAAEFGLRDGFCVPIHGATGWQSAFSFAHDRKIDASPRELAAAHLLALTVYGRLRILHSEEPHARTRLTPREREVLTWAAAGKSAWETSALLGISEATVITHLDNTRRKLNAANTTHAVVVALQTGELQLY